MSNPTSTIYGFKVGDRVVARDTIFLPGQPPVQNPYPGTVGVTGTVTSVDGGSISVDWDRPTGDHGRGWGAVWFDPAEQSIGESVPGRPVVHFDDELAGRDRSKARQYAAEAMSRSLDAEHNRLLGMAADGESVDAYRLNEAITAAIRSAVTRKGQSTARREQAARFAHVAHIVQAVLENHADNLPAYAEGERSRLLEEAKGALEEARLEIESLTAQYEEIKAHRNDLDVRDMLIADLNGRLAEFEERARFTESLLDDAGQNKVLGWRYGYAAGKKVR